MQIRDYLTNEEITKLKSITGPKKKPPSKKKRKDKLSQSDLKELMGMNRDTYKRGKGGAIRRR